MEMVNQASLVGFIKRVFDRAEYTTDFIISVKRKDSEYWDDILCKVNNTKTNGWCREKNIVSIAGVLRTDSWPVDGKGNSVKDVKDATGKYFDERIKGWNSKTYLVVVAAKAIPQETTDKFDKLVMDGITASSGSAISVA
jgi:hypothetical protein